jgi:hypothetical protein
MANTHQTQEEQKISDQEILWKILHSVEKIDATLIGTAYTNNKGLVHKVEEHSVAIDGIDKRLREVELGTKTEEKLEKKSNSFWGVAASVAAAIVSIIALLFSFKK